MSTAAGRPDPAGAWAEGRAGRGAEEGRRPRKQQRWGSGPGRRGAGRGPGPGPRLGARGPQATACRSRGLRPPPPPPARDGYVKARGGGGRDPRAGGRLGQGWAAPGVRPAGPPGPSLLPRSPGSWLPATGLSEKRAGGRGRGREGRRGWRGRRRERGACEEGPGPRRL